MEKVIVNASSLADIAAAIREVSGSDTHFLPSEMGDAVRNIGNSVQANVEFGTFSPEEETNKSISVPHGLGVIPAYVFIWNPLRELRENGLRCSFSYNGPSVYEAEIDREMPSFGYARACRDTVSGVTVASVAQGLGEDEGGDSATHFHTPYTNLMKLYPDISYHYMAVAI